MTVPDLAGVKPANTNASRFVETWPVGDPLAFARLLARVLVRRALIDGGMIPEPRCENLRRAG
jgi:hypothetical protein